MGRIGFPGTFPQDRSGRKGRNSRKTGNGRKGKVDHKDRMAAGPGKKAAPERFIFRFGAAFVRSVMRSWDDRFFSV